MTQGTGAGVKRGRRVRADVRQALLKSGFAHLYPGIAPEEWQPASVMVNQVVALRSGAPSRRGGNRDRVLDWRHFEFRGRLSAGALDDQRRSRLEGRQERRAELEENRGGLGSPPAPRRPTSVLARVRGENRGVCGPTTGGGCKKKALDG